MVNTFNMAITLILLPTISSQSIYQSLIDLSHLGRQYSPSNPAAQFLTAIYVSTFGACAVACNNNPLCQVFDYNALDRQQCRLFEGDLQLMGSVIDASFADSQVGSVQLQASLFAQHEQPCSIECQESRYLACGSAMTCECLGHNYWDLTNQMCLPKVTVVGGSCQSGLNMCREDLNYTCSTITHQCERK